MKVRSYVSALIFVLGIAAVSCGGSGGSKDQKSSLSARQTAKAAKAAAKGIYKSYCMGCHGEFGIGDGAAAVALDPKPRSFRDKAWQKSVDDARIKKAILEGGQAVGLKSPLMVPAASQFEGKPEGTIDEMVKIIRAFGK